MKFREYLSEAQRPSGPEPMGKVNAQDRGWLTRSLEFWRGEQKKHPRTKKVKESIAWFEYWLSELDKKEKK